MLAALLDAYQASGREVYLEEARSLVRLIAEHHLDPSTGLLVNRTPLAPGTELARGVPMLAVMYDQPMPSPQATLARALFVLHGISSETRYERDARRVLQPARKVVGMSSAAGLGALADVLELSARGDAVIVIVGAAGDPRTNALLERARRSYRPGKVVVALDAADADSLPAPARAMFAATRDREVPLAFVCAGTACAHPAESADVLAATIATFGVEKARAPLAARLPLLLERPHVEFEGPRARVLVREKPVALCDRSGREHILVLELRETLADERHVDRSVHVHVRHVNFLRSQVAREHLRKPS
jgi:uncharacterized protein YyaL (SSP411 family)